VSEIAPVVEQGAYPAKAAGGELVTFKATVFREGHDAVAADVVLTSPNGAERRVPMRQVEPVGLDHWEAETRLDEEGDWTFRVEAYSDPWQTWKHNAAIKLEAGQDVELVLAEGRDLLKRAGLKRADPAKAVTDPDVDAAMRAKGPRELVSPTPDYPIRVDRKRAQFASWYEFFPRSVGAKQDPKTGKWESGTFDDCHPMLERIAEMGFDVVYLPPIHPIGQTLRKGRDNTLTAADDDPGSPWAIGSADGGHDAVHPDLGGMPAFERFVTKAKSLGLEVALDFALQASPDHPWLTEHPEWFTTRLDGTIAYAENPPKKYQDIYPVNFDNDPEGIRAECLRLLRFWIAKGVTIFRVDNPHTKPIDFWDWLLGEVRRTDPDVLFLAEAFTRPAMMRALAKVGFHENYTYFAWRNEKWELEQYLTELSTETEWILRPNFFTNTPDINPFFTQSGKAAAFAIRLILAATMSPAWGVYSGFELLEHTSRGHGSEEYADSEKYEYRPRDYAKEPNLNRLMGKLNAIRRAHPALQQIRQTKVFGSWNEQVLAFGKRDGDDRIIVVVSLNPDWHVQTGVELDLGFLGLEPGEQFRVRDLLTGDEFAWGASDFVALNPYQPAHILHVL
jgi:starch synthase (maltosyl-transferring)